MQMRYGKSGGTLSNITGGAANTAGWLFAPEVMMAASTGNEAADNLSKMTDVNPSNIVRFLLNTGEKALVKSLKRNALRGMELPTYGDVTSLINYAGTTGGIFVTEDVAMSVIDASTSDQSFEEVYEERGGTDALITDFLTGTVMASLPVATSWGKDWWDATIKNLKEEFDDIFSFNVSRVDDVNPNVTGAIGRIEDAIGRKIRPEDEIIFLSDEEFLAKAREFDVDTKDLGGFVKDGIIYLPNDAPNVDVIHEVLHLNGRIDGKGMRGFNEAITETLARGFTSEEGVSYDESVEGTRAMIKLLDHLGADGEQMVKDAYFVTHSTREIDNMIIEAFGRNGYCKELNMFYKACGDLNAGTSKCENPLEMMKKFIDFVNTVTSK